MTFATSSPGASTAGQGNTPPICQNCTTSTTPLWRRDEAGSVLCNACGLFLKLHGRPRPISLKTDVIKSRNRVKNSGQPAKRKAQSLYDHHHKVDTPPPSHRHQRIKTSHMSTGSLSPQSRGHTPLPPHQIAPASLFDSLVHTDGTFLGSPSLPPMGMGQPSPGSTSSLHDRGVDSPQTYDGLVATNNALKTRVSELELVNDLFRSRVSELENSEASARRSEITRKEIEVQLRMCINESQRREEELRRRVDLLERELQDLREQNAHQRKKMRVSDLVSLEDGSAPSTPQSTM